MGTPQKLAGAKEFLSQVQVAAEVYRLISVNDLQKFSMIKGEGSKSILNITKCDIEHLTLQPVKKDFQPITRELQNSLLSRSLLLRYHIGVSYLSDKHIIAQLALSKQLSVTWEKEDFLEVMSFLIEWITWKKLAYTLLHEFALKMESIRPVHDWRDHILHETFVNIFERERKSLRIFSGTPISFKTLSDSMCNDCKKKASLRLNHLIDSMNRLAPHFRTILFEFYSNPEAAGSKKKFIDAVQECKTISKNFDVSLNIDIQSSNPSPIWSTLNLTYEFNKTVYSMYHPSKYPDEKGLILLLTLSIENMKDLSEIDMSRKDCAKPVMGSVIQHGLNYNRGEFETFYKAIVLQLSNYINMSGEEVKGKVRKLNLILKSILKDVEEYSTTRYENGRIIVNECDVEHLNLQPMQTRLADVDENEITLEDTLQLPRALKLRTHLEMALKYKKKLSLLLQLIKMTLVTKEWEQECGEELSSLIKEMLSLKSKVNKAVQNCARSMEKERQSLLWGKNNLNVACGRTARSVNAAIRGAEEVSVKRSEDEISLLCNECKEFDLKSQEMLSKLSEYLQPILSTYYENPKVLKEYKVHRHSKESEAFNQAVPKCTEILKEFGFSIKVNISEMGFDKSKPSISIPIKLNLTHCIIYDTNEENNGSQLNIYFARNLENDKRGVDFNSPLPNSATGFFLKCSI